jgi:SAM-dependent methyltransferase
MFSALARTSFRALGLLSNGIALGCSYGFSSGEMLDYVYENRARGRGPLGRWIDRVYLDSIGWRGIRERRANLVRTLTAIVLARRTQGLHTRIVDVASGPGRYLVDLAEALGGSDLSIECRDADYEALVLGRALVAQQGVPNVEYVQHDALDASALAAIPPADVIVISGLYEILLDAPAIRASLRGIHAALKPHGLLVLTGQPRHPQLKLIGNVLTHRDGTPWRMHLRSTATLEAWCRAAGFVDAHTQGDSLGIFSITVARSGRAADVEGMKAFGRLVPDDLDVAHVCAGRTSVTPADHVLDDRPGALEHRFDAARFEIPNPAC